MSILSQVEAHVGGVPFGRDEESGWKPTLIGLLQGSTGAKATGTFAVNQTKVAVWSVGKQIRDFLVAYPPAPINWPGALIDVVDPRKHQYRLRTFEELKTEDERRFFSALRMKLCKGRAQSGLHGTSMLQAKGRRRLASVFWGLRRQCEGWFAAGFTAILFVIKTAGNRRVPRTG